MRLVIMSATLRIDDFVKNHDLFGIKHPPWVITISSRQFDVSCHFSKTTESDYVSVC